MRSRIPFTVVIVALIAVLAWVIWSKRAPSASAPASMANRAATSSVTPVPAATTPAKEPTPEETAGYAATARLNSPKTDIRQDLQVLNEMFFTWQTNFHENPVGLNSEITSALTGHNKLRLSLISPRNPAINAKGELCDRWGTPFFFHQLSANKMEIRSAGPDKKMWNADDTVLTP